MASSDAYDNRYHAGVAVLRQADGLLLTAGAGMGVESGLLDFRGLDGFCKHYPALRSENVRFQDIASPQAFHENPRRVWGFYGRCMRLYRDTVSHRGFQILQPMQATWYMAHLSLPVTSTGSSRKHVIRTSG